MGQGTTDAADAALISAYCVEMEWAGLARTTRYVRRTYLEKLSREVGLRTATTDEIKAWLTRPSLTPQSVGVWLANLHVYYAWCVKKGHLEVDPTADIVKPKAKKGRPRPIADGDLNRALATADPQMRAWLLLGSMMGLRCCEIAGISREDVTEDDLTVTGKGNKERTIPLHHDVLAALDALPMATEGRLWDLDAQKVSRAINKHLRSVGSKSTAHCLRHYFGTSFYRASLDLQLTADMLGHANTAITSTYAASDRRKAAAVVASIRVGAA